VVAGLEDDRTLHSRQISVAPDRNEEGATVPHYESYLARRRVRELAIGNPRLLVASSAACSSRRCDEAKDVAEALA
jgi:hypothetical protein